MFRQNNAKQLAVMQWQAQSINTLWQQTIRQQQELVQQRQTLKQNGHEINRLKEQPGKLQQEIDDLKQEIDRLKQERDGLKEEALDRLMDVVKSPSPVRFTESPTARGTPSPTTRLDLYLLKSPSPTACAQPFANMASRDGTPVGGGDSAARSLFSTP